MWFRSNAPIVVGAILFALAPAIPLAAQQERWEESMSRALTLHQQGNYAAAVQWSEEALRVAEGTFGSEHPNVATSLNSLAVLYKDLGKYVEAEPLFRRALAIREKAQGPEHLEVANALNNLAVLYKVEGKYAEAEPLFQRALVIREKALGAEHLDVASLLNNLARLYEAQGRYSEAEPLFQRALAIREKALGAEHVFVADSLNNLGGLYKAQGKYAEAESLLKRALAIREKALGPEHLDVASALDSLALLYRDQGQNAEAEPLFRRALAIQEKALGPGHPNVAILLNSLAAVYEDQGKYAEAEPLYQRALSIEEKVLGPEHPITETTLMSLGLLYYGWEQPRQAEVFLERSVQNLGKQFEQRYSSISEQERQAFLDLVTRFLPIYFSFCFTYREQNPALVGKMYDVLLWEKGLLSRSNLRSERAPSGGTQTRTLSEQFKTGKEPSAGVANGQSANGELGRRRDDKLERTSTERRQKPVEGTATFAEEKLLAQVTWKDVRKALKEGEAAVELVRFPLQNGKRGAGPAYYAALVVTPGSTTAPSMVLLGRAKNLVRVAPSENEQQAGSEANDTRAAEGVNPQQETRATPEQTSFPESFWEPLEPALAKTRRVFLSPDWGLDQLALGVIPVDQRRLPAEMYDLRIVSSTGDLLWQGGKPATTAAALGGKTKFDLVEAQRMAAISRSKVGGSAAGAAGKQETQTADRDSQPPLKVASSTSEVSKTEAASHPPAATTSIQAPFAVQIGAYEDRAFAEGLVSRLAARYQVQPLLSPVEVRGKTLHRVRIPAKTKAEAEALAGRIHREEKLQVWVVPMP